VSSFHPLAYHSPGPVTVEVVSSTGSYLGQTSFTYIDVVDYIFKELEDDYELHRRFFHVMAQEVGNALRNPGKRQLSTTIPGFKTPGEYVLSEALGLLIFNHFLSHRILFLKHILNAYSNRWFATIRKRFK